MPYGLTGQAIINTERSRMSKEAAQLVLQVATRHGAELDGCLADIQRLCTAEEFDIYKHMVGQVMGAILLDMINPIVAKYPDLKPPQLSV